MCKRLRACATTLAVVATAGSAAADSNVDEMEHLFGATNVTAALGEGALSAGIAATGELTVLRWPSPSYFEQLYYLTATESDRTKTARALPHFGAAPDAGSFAGVVVGGAAKWLHEDGWTRVQQWDAPDSPVLVTTFTGFGLTVVQEDVVARLDKSGEDVLARRYSLKGGAAPLFYYASFSPCITKTAELPLQDWFFDDQTNSVLEYDVPADALVASRTAEGSGDAGVFIALGGDRASTDHPVGDAFEDAADGVFVERRGAKRTGALVFDLKDHESVTMFFAAAATRAPALAVLARAKREGFGPLAERARASARAFLSRARLPDTDDPRVQLMAKRALLNLRTGMDRATGAIVASITTQPPYAQDWPRDGSFIDLALDEAGFPELVEQHVRFYLPLQRTEDESARRPAGSWAMNFYADGTPGGPIDFEIDNTSILVWSMVEHAAYLDAAGKDPKPWLNEIYPTVKRTADLLVRWKDGATGLQARANEDDKVDFTQGLVGASAVRAALDAAVRAAQRLGRAEDEAAWKARLDELDAAIATHLWDEAAGHFKETNPYFTPDNHGGAWIAWPAQLWPAADPRMARHLDFVLDALDARLVRREGPGSSYDAKATLALARLWAGDAAARARLKPALEVLAKDVPSPLGNYGEVYVHDAAGVWENRVAPPHLWEGALNYLAACAFYGKRGPSGCGCGGPGAGAGWAALGVALFALRPRRR